MKIEQILGMMDLDVKVYFKEHSGRYPMIGKFVHLKDGQELAIKKMVRFIRQDRLEDWDGFSIAPSKIFVVTDFKMVEINGRAYL